MPTLNDIVEEREKRKKKFKKKSYRAWDFSGEIVESLEQDANNVTQLHADNEASVIPGTLVNIVPEKAKEKNDGAIQGVGLKEKKVELLPAESKNIQSQVRLKDENVKSNLSKAGARGRKSLAAIQQEKVINSPPSIHQKIICLKGAQEKVFAHIVAMCNQNEGLVTGPIYSAMLLSIAGCTYEVLKMAIKRLIRKNLIQRDSIWAQKGPGSALHFVLTSEEVKQFAIDYFKPTSV